MPTPSTRPTFLSQWVFGALVPALATSGIVIADYYEGPKTAFVGTLACIPLLSAIFATPVVTGFVAAIAWFAAFEFGLLASDGNHSSQTVRLVIIAVVGLIAISSSAYRVHSNRLVAQAIDDAARTHAHAIAAMLDPMTKIPNRLGLTDLLINNDWLIRTVVMFDCDKLKAVNDQFGHLAGDAYIAQVANSLKSHLPDDSILGRWGGDEFLAVIPRSLEDSRETIRDALAVLEHSTIHLDGEQIHPRVSAGIANWERHDSLEVAIRDADAAMYHAKDLGGNRVEETP
jgi:diguanylate cyclase (GGDEF)-like protein